jgi:hypothetical protein
MVPSEVVVVVVVVEDEEAGVWAKAASVVRSITPNKARLLILRILFFMGDDLLKPFFRRWLVVLPAF